MWEKMWSDMGEKLKVLAQVICVLGMIASLVYAITVWNTRIPGEPVISYFNNATHIQNNQTSTFWPGLLALVIGCLLSWVGSWILYGFGLIVESAEKNLHVSSAAPYVGIDAAFLPKWTCPKCKSENLQSKVQCQKCGAVRK